MSLRVLHISTFDAAGGAARAAWNLCRGLRNAGCDARMLVRDRTSTAPGVVQAQSTDRALQARHHEASLIQRKLLNPARSPFTNSWYSLPEPGWDISRHPEVLDAEVLHLHWVSGFLSPASIRLLQQTGKPLFWTMHDQRPFTGGCHFSAGCGRYERDCNPCPQLEGRLALGLAHAALAEAQRQIDPAALTVVCPSRWMADCVRRSTMFCKSRLEIIPNSVDTDAFHPGHLEARQRLGWSRHELVLLAGAGETTEIRKGFGQLLEALRVCACNPVFKAEASAGRIRLVLFGAGTAPENLPLPVECTGTVESQSRLADLYAAADAFLAPSIEDNLPNTMIESLCCGTPVIGFEIGGIPDAVMNSVNGWLVRELSAASLGRELTAFCLDPARRSLDRVAIARDAAEKFNPKRQAEQMLQLYRDLVSTNGRTAPAGQREVAWATASPQYKTAFQELLRQAKRAQWNNRIYRIGRTLGLVRRRPRVFD